MPFLSLQVRRELAAVLNRNGVDNQLNIPDYILADIAADSVEQFANNRTKLNQHQGRPDSSFADATLTNVRNL